MSRWARALRLASLLAVSLFVGSIVIAVTAANTVPTSKAGYSSLAITPNTLKPTNCSGITLTAKISGSGAINGTAAAELITGSAAVDTITAQGGTDCLLGGASNDSLNGGFGTDVCIGGAGVDTFTSCETQIQ